MHFVIVTWNLKSIIKCTGYKTLFIYQFIIDSVSSLSSSISKCGQELMSGLAILGISSAIRVWAEVTLNDVNSFVLLNIPWILWKRTSQKTHSKSLLEDENRDTFNKKFSLFSLCAWIVTTFVFSLSHFLFTGVQYIWREHNFKVCETNFGRY